MKEIKLSSGVMLKITLVPFADGNALYKAIASECKGISMRSTMGPDLIKDIFCTLIESDRIEKCIWKCFERATFNGLKIRRGNL